MASTSGASESLVASYDRCNLDNEGNSDVECAPPCENHADCEPNECPDDASDDDASSEETTEQDDDDASSEQDDDDAYEPSTLVDALQSIDCDAEGVVWIIRKSDGSVGYVRSTSEVLAFFERAVDDCKQQHGWESLIDVEWDWAKPSGLMVALTRVALPRTFGLWQGAGILETYHVLSCSPMDVDVS